MQIDFIYYCFELMIEKLVGSFYIVDVLCQFQETIIIIGSLQRALNKTIYLLNTTPH